MKENYFHPVERVTAMKKVKFHVVSEILTAIFLSIHNNSYERVKNLIKREGEEHIFHSITISLSLELFYQFDLFQSHFEEYFMGFRRIPFVEPSKSITNARGDVNCRGNIFSLF